MEGKIFRLVRNVYDKTLASDIVPVEPIDNIPPRETTSLDEDIRALMESRERDDTREVTESDRCRVREIVGGNIDIDDEELGLDLYWTKGGKIAIRTPQRTWMALCGREWHVDSDNGTYDLAFLN